MFLFKEVAGTKVVGTTKNPKFRFFIFNEDFKLMVAEHDQILNNGAFLACSKQDKANEIIKLIKQQYNVDVISEEFNKLDSKMDLAFYLTI